VKRYMGSFLNRESLRQLIKVGIVGVGNTVASFVLFNLFLTIGWSSVWSVTAAFGITTFLSYLLNRAWTFELTNGKVSGRETLHFYAVNVAAWAGTAGAMWVAETLFGPLSRVAANAVYLGVSLLILLPKFASYRDLVFGAALDREGRVPSRR
jgi:putative flippase GtrA